MVGYDHCYCGDDDQEAEADLASAEARGCFHKVTLDVKVRIKVDALGASHETDDVEDMVTGDALCNGDILSVEEV